MDYKVGDKLFYQVNNQYNGYPCVITKIEKNKSNGTDFTIKLKAESWLRAEEGKKVWLHFDKVPMCNLKKTFEEVQTFGKGLK
jgi:hypothetical protein